MPRRIRLTNPQLFIVTAGREIEVKGAIIGEYAYQLDPPVDVHGAVPSDMEIEAQLTKIDPFALTVPPSNPKSN